MKQKVIRITTVPASLKVLLKGQLAFINKYFDVVAISSSGRELDEVEEDEGVRVYSVEMSRKITPFKDTLSILKLFLLFKKENPYIVHSHTPKAGFVSMIAAYFAKVPIRLHTVAGLPLMESRGLKRAILMIIERITYSSATLILPNSFGMQEFIVENKLVKKNKFKIIGNGSSNGIDLNHFKSSHETILKSLSIQEKYNLKDKFIFLYIGRLVSHKGMTELIAAFTAINKKYSETRLLLVGDFEKDLDPLSFTTLKLLENSSIIHLGFQNDVRGYLEIADVFVFPSYREGFPNVVLQACAFNLPCIVTAIKGCMEIINDNENGLVISPKDIDGLKNAMEILFMSSDLRKRLGEKNRKHIENKYSQQFVWGNILKLYSSLTI